MLKEVAADALETAVSDLEIAEGGAVRVAGTDRLITFADLARRSEARRRALVAEDAFVPEEATYPNGTHLAEVEIDPDTGATRIVNYCVVDDFGATLNPLLLAGQVHIYFSPLPQAIAFIKDGRLRTLGVTTTTRLHVLPDIPAGAYAVTRAPLPGSRNRDRWGPASASRKPFAAEAGATSELEAASKLMTLVFFSI